MIPDSQSAAQSVEDNHGAVLSKSKYLGGLQCPKLLWHTYHARDLMPKPSTSQFAIFDQGHQVGALAKLLYPTGVDAVHETTDFEEGLRLTRKKLALRVPLFEAAFESEGCYARADILVPVPGTEDAWDILEVKSSTVANDIHVQDLAFQAWVFTNAGLKIRNCMVVHIDSDFVRNGNIKPQEFFKLTDVTYKARALYQEVEDNVSNLFKVIRQPAFPEIAIGPQCDDPYTCPLHDHCWSFLPDQSVADLYRGGKKGFKLLADGISDLRKIPDTFKLAKKQAIQKATAIANQPHIHKKALKTFLEQLKYPLHFLDFETFATAIPMFNGLCPYTQVPFQFSLHIVESLGAEPTHVSFLADGKSDPRPEFMRNLVKSVGEQGTVVAYNASFELNCMRECCQFLPEHAVWLAQVEPRIVDLLKPFRDFHYYHPNQHGSASMKVVLPALTGKSYKDLAIQEGGAASLEYLRVTFADVPSAERQRVRRHLEEYCGLDTLGMVWIVDSLRSLSSENE
jgi:hypothetical protein